MMTRLFRELLQIRGLSKDFIQPRYEDLFDSFLLPGMKEAVERIFAAVERGEKVVIYGDYDVDGVTAATVMEEGLRAVGCEVVKILLPDRFRDGYGMNMGMVGEVEKLGANLVVTVDCGSSNLDVIKALRESGVDVIVTDHHEIGEGLEDGLREKAILLNPKRKDCEVGKRLSGAGVVFMLARALNMKKNRGRCDGQEKWLLDLVAVGTVCDAMELLEENRILVYYGMKVLAKTRREGLRALIEVSGIDKGKMTTHAIGYQLGPRLNAGGRLESAEKSLQLLRARSRAEAFRIADELNELNKKRRAVQEKALTEIEVGVDEKQSVIVARGAWHEGVIGIVAGRLVERYKKPAMVVTETAEDDDGDGFADKKLKLSGRSFGEFSLAECIDACRNLLIKGGGHAAACGATLEEKSYEEFVQKVQEFYKGLELKNQERFLVKKADMILDDLSEVTEEFADELVSLEPFGEGNPEPIFETEATVFSKRVLKEKHLALTVRDGKGKFFRLMGFFADENWMKVVEMDEVRVKFTVLINEFRGERKVEGRIVALEQM